MRDAMGENRPMQRPHYLAFGLAGYSASLLSMVYFGGFLANLLVPKSVDSVAAGPTVPAGRADSLGSGDGIVNRADVRRG